MVKLNMTVSDEDSPVSPKVLVYQRTPTPRYEHWPHLPHSKSDTVTDDQPNTPENHKEDSGQPVTKLDTLHSDSTPSSNSSCDPPGGSCDLSGSLCDTDIGTKDPQDCPRDPDGGSCDQNNLPPVKDVHNDNGSRDPN